MAETRVLWTPPNDAGTSSGMGRFISWLAHERNVAVDGYEAAWRWSVEDIEGFWASVWTYFDVPAREQPARILDGHVMPGATWFRGATLNYAEMALADADDRPAIVFAREDGSGGTLSRRELAREVGAVAAGLRRMGVGAGDRVAGYLPNAPEAVVAFLATASIGAIWSCCSPDFGARAVIDRFRQIEPAVLIAVDGYRYGGRVFDRRDVLVELRRALPSTTIVRVPSLDGDRPDHVADRTWAELAAERADPVFEAVPFEHPLWILYSSGTTGLPKAMVHGHGGILVEHLKSLALHLDLGPASRFFWFTTTGWMMWNFLVSGLLLRSTIVLYDGSPTVPDLGALWRLVDRAGVTYFGTSAPFLHASMRADVQPRAEAELAELVAIGSTGAPLTPEAFDWVAGRIGGDVWLGSISGGTDLCTAVVSSCPLLPVRAGEIQCRCLGARVEAFDERGRSLIDEVGELVITEPMPSMPVSFWNDPDGTRYRSSYFDVYPNVWRHGDWLRILPHGGCVITGRSDATLNRGGVRLGSSELYRVVEAIPGVEASLVVDTGGIDGEGELILFVATADGVVDERLRTSIAERLRSELSPRHVPDRIVGAPGIPTTLNGKRMEVPVKRLLLGEALERVASLDAVSDAEVFRWFVTFAEAERATD